MPLFKTAEKRYTVDFTPVYGTLDENQLLRAQQNQEGDTDIPFTVPVYLFLAKNAMVFFILTWFLRTCVYSSSVKNPEQHIHPLSRVIHSQHCIHGHVLGMHVS